MLVNIFDVTPSDIEGDNYYYLSPKDQQVLQLKVLNLKFCNNQILRRWHVSVLGEIELGSGINISTEFSEIL